MKHILLAQSVQVGGQNITGPLTGFNTLGDVVNAILPFILGIAGVILFLILLWGGYEFLMSQGEPAKVKSAQGKITAAVVGFVLLVLSFMFARLVSFIFFGSGGII